MTHIPYSKVLNLEVLKMEGHYRVPSLFSKCSNPALRPGPPPKPLSN